jgi:flagellar protein FlgJ
VIINNESNGFSLAVEAYGLNRVDDRASSQRQAEIKEVARQFEALLMHTLLKNMRATTSQDGLLDNDQTRLYTSLLDQEIGQLVSRRGLGLAEILERQLSKLADPSEALPWQAIKETAPDLPDSWNAVAAPGMAANLAVAEANARLSRQRSEAVVPVAETKQAPHTEDLSEAQDKDGRSHVDEFIDAMRPHAANAAKQSGIPVQFLIGHAALESGWGRYQIRNPDGESSHNLFGIKADTSWSGDVAEVMTTEYIGGLPVKSVERFRAYDSYETAFADYADFLRSNPRYTRALQATGDARAFANELQSAGYATDPRYADKLTAVINHRLLRNAV